MVSQIKERERLGISMTNPIPRSPNINIRTPNTFSHTTGQSIIHLML